MIFVGFNKKEKDYSKLIAPINMITKLEYPLLQPSETVEKV